jgi:hypothetical protein
MNAIPKIYANLALIIVHNEIFIPLWSISGFAQAGISKASETVDLCQADLG